MRRRRPRNSIVRCPHCGHAFPFGKLACPECGSDMETGWNDDAGEDWGDVPDEFTAEDYRNAVAGLPGSTVGDWPLRKVVALVVGLLLVLSMLLFW